MSTLATVVVGIIAAIHVYIAFFEAFLWKQRGPKVFRSFPKDLFPRTTAIAANMGAYNAIVAAGLIWSLTISDDSFQRSTATFFLCAVAFAGVVGGLTAERRILMVQTVPALIALLLVWV